MLMMQYPKSSERKVRRPICVLLYVLGGMCLCMSLLAFKQGMFNESSILWLSAMIGIGIAALIDSGCSK